MFSCMSPPHHFLIPSRLLGYLHFRTISPPLAVAVNPRLRSSGFFGRLKGRHYEGCWCSSKGWESEGDVTLEAEILEFMEKSEKPEAFPTREELVNAGRTDLAEAIVRKGGWLSVGWDFGDDIVEEEEEEVEVVGLKDKDCDSSGGSSVWANSCHSPSSSGRSLEMGDEQETGIEGILTRLEKQRNLSFGINLGGNGYSARALSRDGGNESHIETSKYVDIADLGRSSRLASGSPNKGIFNNSGRKISHAGSVSDFDSSRSSVKPEMWQTWSIRRAGISDSEFEAAEISFHDNQMEEGKGASKDEIHAITEGSTEALNKQKDISHNEIRTRLRHLELELTSALRLLRSNSEKHVPEDGHETSDDLRKVSDAWEFQENEIMSTRDRLRSIRAKLTVAEGKMTLAIIDAQKIVEEKQKRIDGARTALKLLRTTCIVWPNSASEVLLAGSFDGWTTQRKMEKSSTGIFSVCLKLYPGRYEIKFIVDGTWRIDPLRPVVRNDGYENNLLVIS